MKHAHIALVALAVAVLVGGLTGCRSRMKSQPAQQPGPMVQAPTPTYTPTYTPAPVVTQAPSGEYTQPYTGGDQVGTVVSRRVISRSSAPDGTQGMGSPDGMVGGGYPEAFPDAQPAQLGGPSSSVPVISAAADTGADLDVQLDLMRAQLNDLRGEIEAAKTAPVARVETTSASGGSLAAQFADELRTRTGGDVTLSGNTVVIRVSDAFESGSNQLKKDSSVMSTLQATASALAEMPAASVEVVGHSDSTPLKRTKSKWGTNKILSQARAQTVATELSRHGVPASRMDVKGVGSAEPLDARNTKQAHAKNRRVEVVVRF